jgi:hypothetical protein
MSESLPAVERTRRWNRLDLLAAGFVGLVCSALSVRMLLESGYLIFYQNFAPELVYAACGLGYSHPGDIPPALQDFLLLRRHSFDCSLLDSRAALGPITYFPRLQQYLSLIVVSLWRAPILDYLSLWPLVAALSAAFGSGCFVLLRLFLPRLPSLLGASLIAISPIALSLVVYIRDYSKAPFFIWGLVCLLCAIRTRSLLPACIYTGLAGVVVGVGIGFRADLWLLLPVGCLALVIVTSWRDLGIRIPAMFVFAAVSLAAGWPILSFSAGSSSGTILMQGLSDRYQRFLGLGEAPYGLGARYSDELVLSSVAAAERPRTPGWDANEPSMLQGMSQSMTKSGQNALEWMPAFVGDLATQGLKSWVLIAAMPVVLAQGRPPDPAFAGVSSLGPVQFTAHFYRNIGHSWLVPLSLSGLLLFAWRETALRPREFPATAFLIAIVAASTMVQFAVRHFFHLEFIWVITLLSIPMAIRDREHLVKVARLFWLWLFALTAAGAVVYACLLTYQQQTLKASFSNLLALPREVIDVQQKPDPASSKQGFVLTVPIPTEHEDIVNAQNDSMDSSMPLRGVQWDVRAEADRLALTLSGCPAGTYAVTLRYTKKTDVWQPFDDEVILVVGNTGQRVQAVFSAFYRPTQHLSNVVITPYVEGCEARLERILGESRLPHLLIAKFPDGWQNSYLFRSFGGFGEVPW